MTRLPRPLTGPPPSEVPLPRAPLARVIGQVAFPRILAIRNPDIVAKFQEMIRATYPILSEDRMPHIVVPPMGIPHVEEGVAWRFGDSDGTPKWRVSLAPDFLALETTAYLSRQDFLERLRVVTSCFEEALKPTEARRLGIRHINRLSGDAVDRLDKLIKPKVLGIAQPNGGSPTKLAGAVIHLLTEAQFLTDEGRMLARWGSLPANTTIDPAMLDPIDKPSWVIDLDMFVDTPQPFKSDKLISTAKSFAERVYSVFREMVTDEFLKFYGGKP
jgi:uncharacterized protein (TIGR04255 family)